MRHEFEFWDTGERDYGLGVENYAFNKRRDDYSSRAAEETSRRLWSRTRGVTQSDERERRRNLFFCCCSFNKVVFIK